MSLRITTVMQCLNDGKIPPDGMLAIPRRAVQRSALCHLGSDLVGEQESRAFSGRRRCGFVYFVVMLLVKASAQFPGSPAHRGEIPPCGRQKTYLPVPGACARVSLPVPQSACAAALASRKDPILWIP